MWEIDSLKQLENFGFSVLLGALLCFLYDIIFSVRHVNRFSWLKTFVCDILFWIISALLVYCFLLATVNGEVRWYLLFGAGVGFLIIRVSFTKIIRRVLCGLLTILRRLYTRINSLTKNIITKVNVILHNIFNKIASFFKKCLKLGKKLLKKGIHMLYTKRVDCEINNEQVDYEN